MEMPDGSASDGCSGWPDGDWEDCCFFHDIAYRSGDYGFWARRKADVELFACVARKGYPGIAILMFFGVRAFGWVPFHKNYRKWVGKKAEEIRKEEERKDEGAL